MEENNMEENNMEVTNMEVNNFLIEFKKLPSCNTLEEVENFAELYECLKEHSLVQALDSVLRYYSCFYWTQSNLLNAECEVGVKIPSKAWRYIVGLMEDADIALAKVLLVEPSMVMGLYTDYPNIYDNDRDGFGCIDKGVFKDYCIPECIIEGFVNALNKLKDELLKVGYYG